MTTFYAKANKAVIEFSPYDHQQMTLDYYRQLDPCRPNAMAQVVARVAYKFDHQYAWVGLLGIDEHGQWVRWELVNADHEKLPKVLLA